ncbi:transposase [Paenibacillus tritici]|uniref:Transposase n=1 Tax=Paenibacillus tritici TaxID=1873425 RepID=A0ABX2DN80_9BACL|nr:transposase [Paenibacillus tritici]
MKEKSKAWKANESKIENWTYNTSEDITGRAQPDKRQSFTEKKRERVASGYEIRKRHYRSRSCEGCPLNGQCTKAAGNREIPVSLERLQ